MSKPQPFAPDCWFQFLMVLRYGQPGGHLVSQCSSALGQIGCLCKSAYLRGKSACGLWCWTLTQSSCSVKVWLAKGRFQLSQFWVEFGVGVGLEFAWAAGFYATPEANRWGLLQWTCTKRHHWNPSGSGSSWDQTVHWSSGPAPAPCLISSRPNPPLSHGTPCQLPHQAQPYAKFQTRFVSNPPPPNRTP